MEFSVIVEEVNKKKNLTSGDKRRMVKELKLIVTWAVFCLVLGCMNLGWNKISGDRIRMKTNWR
jgi:hypothetical protein